MRLFALSVTIALLPQEPPADAWFAWHGFGVGSRTVMRKSDIGGAEEEAKTYRRTLTAIEKGWPKIEIEVRAGKESEWDKVGTERVPYEGKSVAALGYTQKELPKGEVTIDGKSVAVTVSAWTKGDVTLTITRAAGLELPLRDAQGPGGTVTLPADTVAWKFAGEGQTFERRVVATGQKRKVGDVDVSCILEEGTVTQKAGDMIIKGKARIWSSAAVPGRKVRSESENDINGKISGSIEELVEFEAKAAK